MYSDWWAPKFRPWYAASIFRRPVKIQLESASKTFTTMHTTTLCSVLTQIAFWILTSLSTSDPLPKNIKKWSMNGNVTLGKMNYRKAFRFCKSVPHHTFKWINQSDAAVSQVYYLSFKYSSTCFGHPHAHHQELQQLPLVYLRSLVTAVLFVVVGPTALFLRHLVYVTLCRWPFGVQMLYWYNQFSWWWEHGCPKHVELYLNDK